MSMSDKPLSTEERRRFLHISAAGITFQGGSAAVDSSTIMAALVYQLTSSPVAVGATTTILRMGWLLPQLVVGYLAQSRGNSLPLFIFGAYGRATCLAILAIILAVSQSLTSTQVAIGVFLLWTSYAFVSGVVAVPYNDIVARSVASARRSRLLALRFFGGSVLALIVSALADRAMMRLPFPASYAVIIGAAAVLMYVSSTLFVWPGEPEKPATIKNPPPSFVAYLREGVEVFRQEQSFRYFVYSQWGSAAAMMAMPFYLVAATELHFDIERVALLLGAQTAGAIASNALWGWWGDSHGKRCLLEGIAGLRTLPPVAILVLSAAPTLSTQTTLIALLTIFFVLGSLANGLTIAAIGFLMEISPDDQRPAYSGYFNALTAPAFLLPLLGGVMADVVSIKWVFIAALTGAALQWLFVRLIQE